VRSGVVVFETAVAADSGGYEEALRLAETHAPGRRAFAVEGAGSYGAADRAAPFPQPLSRARVRL
jgi:hypothetical protein